jgi:hypothetical protein
MTDDQIEVLNRAIADAVLSVVRDDATASQDSLKQVAVNVAAAVEAGFAAIGAGATSGAEPLAPRS